MRHLPCLCETTGYTVGVELVPSCLAAYCKLAKRKLGRPLFAHGTKNRNRGRLQE